MRRTMSWSWGDEEDSSQDSSDESYQETSFPSNYTVFLVQLTWVWVDLGLNILYLNGYYLFYITLFVILGLYMLLIGFIEPLMFATHYDT